MESFRLEDVQLTPSKTGADRFTKVSYPIRYGRFAEVRTPEHLFEFNLNGEVKFIRGLTADWPHPIEWLKRTDANDWVYYSTGGYNEVMSFLGEYYRPCLPYSTNSLWDYNPFRDPAVRNALNAWTHLLKRLRALPWGGLPSAARDFLGKLVAHDAAALKRRAETLHEIAGSPIAVLPPDTRHVDYEIIPLMIADGCRYHCDFCCIKTRQPYRLRSRTDIRRQIRGLKEFYGDNLKNYNALFLGNHDGLAAGGDQILMAAEEAYTAFGFEQSFLMDPSIHMFGSVDALLTTDLELYSGLNRLPYHSYINIGFESADAATLRRLSKPLTEEKIREAFELMLAVNRRYHRIEITANFLIGDGLSESHYGSLIELIRNRLPRTFSKGGIYLSPLNSSRNRASLLRKFVELKHLSRLPAYIYLIQRL